MSSSQTRARAYWLIGVGLLVATWVALGLPPAGGPAVQVSRGVSDVAVGVALPHLVVAIAGVAAAIWGLGILLWPWLMKDE